MESKSSLSVGMIACDLGSNTLRIVEFDSLTCKRINAFERIVRTAKDIHKTSLIGKEAQENIFKALHEASQYFDFKHQQSFCVTTQAMRMAKNADDVLSSIATEFGLHFEIISGEKEAYLTSLAIEHALIREGFNAQTYALFDLGGGSTEIILCHEGKKITHSFPFGIVTTAEGFHSNLAQGVKEVASTMDAFIESLGDIPQTYQQLIATAGTPTTIAAFLEGLDFEHYDSEKINGKCLHVKDFDFAFEQLSSIPLALAERYTGTNRRDLVIVGILLVKTIMLKLGFDRCIVMDDGLREGVAISNCNKKVSSP